MFQQRKLLRKIHSKENCMYNIILYKSKFLFETNNYVFKYIDHLFNIKIYTEYFFLL